MFIIKWCIIYDRIRILSANTVARRSLRWCWWPWAQHIILNTRGGCSATWHPKAVTCLRSMTTLRLRQRSMKIQYLTHLYWRSLTERHVTKKKQCRVHIWGFDVWLWPVMTLLSPVQVHAKPVSQMRTSCIISSWQCHQVRESKKQHYTRLFPWLFSHK